MSIIATAADWEKCESPTTMLTFLGNRFQRRRPHFFGRVAKSDPAAQRKLRLVACGFCRRLWHDLPDGEYRAAVERTEQYADGAISAPELAETREILIASALPFEPVTREKIHRAITNAMRTYPQEDVGRLLYVALSTAWEVGELEAVPRDVWTAAEPQWYAYVGARAAVASSSSEKLRAVVLRDVFPNPFDEPKVKPEWMTWNSETIRRLAEAIYSEHRFGDLPILADALEEAGCDDAAILQHCRDSNPHIRGCWAIDLLRGESSVIGRGGRRRSR